RGFYSNVGKSRTLDLKLTERHRGLVVINLAAVIFGGSALIGEMKVSPWWIVAVRACFATLTLGVIAFIKKESFRFSQSHAWAFLITGSILAFHWVTFFMSVQMAGVAVATVTFAAF